MKSVPSRAIAGLMVVSLACWAVGYLGIGATLETPCEVSPLWFTSLSTSIRLDPIADSWVDKDDPTDNMGGDNRLHSRSDSGGDERLTYLKFDLSSLPSGTTVQSARVYLWEAGGDSAAEVVEVRFVSVDSWTEYGITWNNKPSYASTPTDSVLVGQYAYFSWNVTSDVISQLAGDKILSLAFRVRDLYDQKEWYSRNYWSSSRRPYLEVTVGTLHHFHVHATPSTVRVGDQFSATVMAKDDLNNTITTWTGPISLSAVLASDNSTPGSGVLGVTLVTITSGGTVTTNYETYTKVETIGIKATSGSITGLSNPVTFVAGDPYRIEYLSGDGQSQAAATALTNPFTAKVTDLYGNPIGGQTVSWSIASYPAGATGQSLSILTGPTDASGLARSTLTLGTKVGAYQTSASSAGLVGSPVLFNATATSGCLHRIAVTPNPAWVVVGGTQSFVATGYDQYNNTVPNIIYVWTTDVGSIDNAGVLTAQTSSPDVGFVRATNGTVHGDATVYVIPGVPTKLVLSPESVDMNAGTQYSWFEVQTRDQYDNVAPVSSNLVVSLATTSPTGEFRPVDSDVNVTQVTMLSGQNSTNFDYFDVTVGTYTVTASATGLQPDTSTVRVHVGAGLHFEFDWISSPQIAGVPFNITIYARDSFGNVNSSYTSKAVLADTTGTIIPTQSGNFVAGIWKGTVSIIKAQNDVRITAVDAAIGGISDPFDVIHGDPVCIEITPDPEYVEAGSQMAFSATAFDRFGNSWNVTGLAVFQIVESGHGGSWAGNVYTAYALGTWTVRGSYTFGSTVSTDDATLHAISGLLSLSKLGPNESPPGGQFTYTLAIRNLGTSSAKSVVLVDELPSFVSLVQSSPTGMYNATGHFITWNLPNIPQGESFNITVVVQVNISAPNGALLVNTAQVDWSQREQSYGHTRPTSSVTTKVTALSETQPVFSKAADRTSVIPGDVITFTISIANDKTNAAPLGNVSVNDTLPSVLEFISSTPTASVSAGLGGQTVLTWTFSTMDRGEVRTITYSVRVAGVSDTTVVLNRARLHALSADGASEYSDLNSVVITIRVPKLSIGKSASADSVGAGDQVPFMIEVTNYGAVPAFNITVEEHIPDNMTFVSASGAHSHDAAVERVRWNVDQLDPGRVATFEVTLSIRGTVGRGTVITNTASAMWHDVNENQYGPIYAQCTMVTKGPAGIGVREAVSPSGGVRPGNMVTFTLEVTNTGEVVARGVVVSDHLPPTLIYQAGSSVVLMPDGTSSRIEPTTLDNGTLKWIIDTSMPPSGRVLISFRAKVSEHAVGPIYNVVAVNSTSDTILVPLILANVVATKGTQDLQVERGGRVTYTIEVFNRGNYTASDVVIRDRLPTSLQYLPGTSTLEGQPIQDPRVEVGALVWEPGISLAPGDRAVLSFKARVTAQATGPIVNQAHITYDGRSTATTSDPVFILLPEIVASKRADRERATVGENVTFILTMTNAGNGTAYDVTVTDPLPANFAYVNVTARINDSSIPDPATGASSALVWRLDAPLKAGETLVLSFKAFVQSATVESVENVGRIDWKDGGGNYDNTSTNPVLLTLTQMLASITLLLLAAGPVIMLAGRKPKLVLSDEPLEFFLTVDAIRGLKALYGEIWVSPLVARTVLGRTTPAIQNYLERLMQERTMLVSKREETIEDSRLSREDASSVVMAAELGAELCPSSDEVESIISGLGIATKYIPVILSQLYLRRVVSEAALEELMARLYEWKQGRAQPHAFQSLLLR